MQIASTRLDCKKKILNSYISYFACDHDSTERIVYLTWKG